MLQDMAPAALRSRVIAIGTAVTVGLSSLSPVLVGALSDLVQAGDRGLLLAMASIGAAAFALSAAVLRTAEAPFAKTVQTIYPELAARHA